MIETSPTAMPSLRLGYLVVESTRIAEWRRFAGEAIGMHVDDLPGGSLGLRLDDYERRFLVTPGPAEDVVAVGFELDDEASWGAAEEHLRACGVGTEAVSVQAARARGVERAFGFTGNKGLRFEFFTNPARTNYPLAAKIGAFVTGTSGLGHFVMTTRDPARVCADLKHLLGARLSDTIEQKISGLPLQLSFFHLNQRHHTIAVGGTKGVKLDPIRKRVQHISIEVAALNDLTAAYGRCRALGYRMAMGIGQHPNDHVISFYVITPSGFEFELGWNSLLVDDATWTPGHYDRISAWGHFPEDITPMDRVRTAWTALTSPLRAG